MPFHTFRTFRKFAAAAAVCCAAAPLLAATPAPFVVNDVEYVGVADLCRNQFILAANASPALRDDPVRLQVVIDDADYTCVKKAADMFCSDMIAITGRADAAKVVKELPSNKSHLIIAGTIGHSKFIDSLIEEGKIDVSDVKGKWEHTVWTLPGGIDALVIAGSDRRATAYGLLRISEACGMQHVILVE